MSTNLPTLEDGKPFKVEIKCLQDGFEIFVNKKVGAFKIYLTSVRCSVISVPFAFYRFNFH